MIIFILHEGVAYMKAVQFPLALLAPPLLVSSQASLLLLLRLLLQGPQLCLSLVLHPTQHIQRATRAMPHTYMSTCVSINYNLHVNHLKPASQIPRLCPYCCL